MRSFWIKSVAVDLVLHSSKEVVTGEHLKRRSGEKQNIWNLYFTFLKNLSQV